MEASYWSRLGERRVGRRTVLRAGLTGTAALGASALAAACGSSKSNKSNATAASAATKSSVAATSGGASATKVAATSAAATPVPKSGGTYNVGFTGPFAGVDPHNSVYGGSGIVPVVYSYLVRTSLLAPQVGVIKELATSYEQPDSMTTIFHLRPDAMIAQNSQGVPVRAIDSADVLASYQRIGNPASGSNGYSWIHTNVDKFDAPDAQTFRVLTKQPYAWVINQCGNNLYSAVVPKEWLASPNLKKTAVGSGFFMLTELVEGSHATMVKNPNYFVKGKPYLDSEVIKAFADQATYRTAYTAGQLDTYSASNINEAKQIQKSAKGQQLFTDPSFGFNSIWMNTKIKPWDDPRIRRAISRAVNRDEYIQLIADGQGKEIGPITYAMHPYDLPLDELKTKQQPFSIKDAKDLLSAAGQPNLTFEFQHPTSSTMPDYVNIFVRQMAAAGITAKAQPQDAGTWVAGYYASKLTFSLSLNQEYATPDFALQWFHTGGITGNGHYDTGFSDPAVDSAIDKAGQTLDEQQRVTAYQNVQRLIYSKDPPFLNFFGGYANINAAPYVESYPKGLGSLGYYFGQDIWLNK